MEVRMLCSFAQCLLYLKYLILYRGISWPGNTMVLPCSCFDRFRKTMEGRWQVLGTSGLSIRLMQKEKKTWSNTRKREIFLSDDSPHPVFVFRARIIIRKPPMMPGSKGVLRTRGRDRTGTVLLPLVFETTASTNSATRAWIVQKGVFASVQI